MNKSQLTDNMARRIKNVYKTALMEFENKFPNLTNSREWTIARFNILTVGNDAVRAAKQEIQENEEESNIFSLKKIDNTSYVKQSIDFINMLKNTIFGQESIVFLSKNEKEEKCLSLLHKELNFSLLDIDDGLIKLYICGIYACVTNLIILDYLLWPPDIKKNYTEWRKRISVSYKELG